MNSHDPIVAPFACPSMARYHDLVAEAADEVGRALCWGERRDVARAGDGGTAVCTISSRGFSSRNVLSRWSLISGA